MVHTRLNAQDTLRLNAVFEGVVDALITAASEYFEYQTGTNISVSDKLKLSMARKAFDLSKKFNTESKIFKMIEVSNKVAPLVATYLDEEAVLRHLPEHLRSAEVISLLDRAGAEEISSLLRGLLPPDEMGETVVTPRVAPRATPIPRPVVRTPVPANSSEEYRPPRIESTVGRYDLTSKKLGTRREPGI